MATRARWEQAQEYEQGFWEGVASDIARDSFGRIDFYEWRAGEVRRRLQRLGLDHLLDGSARIAEFGSGPVGVLGFLPAAERVAVDPLNRFYATNEHLSRFRTPEVRYLDAGGEASGLDSGRWDLVIMENCIDHTRDPVAVMREIHRVLSDRGVLYMTVNGRSRPGYFVHRALARMALDPGHPHTFTAGRFRRFLESNGFALLEFEAEPWWRAWAEDLTSRRRKRVLKGLLGVSEHLLYAVSRKVPEGGRT